MKRVHIIENATSGSQSIIIKQGSGATITIPTGDTKVVMLDGAGSGAAVVDAFASLSVVDLKVQDDLTVTDDMTVGGTLGVTGVLTATSLDISGDIDVDGTTNLDVVDIDGAVDMASTLTVGSLLTVNDGAVFNEGSADKDFRVESNGNANMLFVDGGNDRVGIGTVSPANNLHIFTNAGDEGLTIKSTGDTSNAIIIDANRGNAGAAINAFTGKWNGTSVADILFLTGADTTNKDDGVITFRTSSADNISERMRIDSSGNVAIAQTSTSDTYKLQLNGAMRLTGGSGYYYINTGADSGLWMESAHSLRFATSDAERMRIDASGNVTHTFSGGETLAVARDGAGTFVGNTSNHNLRFITNDAERMRIDTSGNVLIGGTTDRSRRFVVEGTGDLMALYSTNAGAGGAQLDLIHDSASPADGDNVGIINFSDDAKQYASVKGIAENTNVSGALHLGVRRDASNYNATAITIKSTGNVELGLGGPLQATADGRAVNASVGTSFVTILDFSTIGGSTAGQGFYLVTVVREGPSVGTSITLQVGVSSSGLVIIYDTIQANGLSAQASNAQIQVKQPSGGAVECHATAIPMSITGFDS